MHNLDMYVLLLAFVQAAFIIADPHPRGVEETQTRKRVTTDPVANFLSDLGGMFLDVDEALAVQTTPKVRLEDRIAQAIRPFVPRPEYFASIRENYKNLQTRLGLLNPDLPENARQLPSAENSNLPKPVPKREKQSAFPYVPKRLRPDLEKFMEKQTKTQATEPKMEEKPQTEAQTIKNPFEETTETTTRIPEEQIQKIVDAILHDAKRANDLLASLGAKTLQEFTSGFQSRAGDFFGTDSSLIDRVTRDTVYAESMYEKYIKGILREHAKWILDNPLMNSIKGSSETTVVSDTTPSSTTIDAARPSETNYESAVTEIDLPSSTEPTVDRKSGLVDEDETVLPIASTNYYDIDDSGKIKTDVDLIYNTEYENKLDEQVNAVDEFTQAMEKEQTETIILAFSPDGVPLKLRMGPEIENPIKYLHKALKSAGVSLNIPVESFEDLEPVGKEILQLGEGTGTMTRALYLDISDESELNSLLRTLAKLKRRRRKH